jgi:hypothetical protein
VGALVVIIIALFLGSVLWLLRWSGSAPTATPDTFWYARDSLRYSGYSGARADAIAARITCGAISHTRTPDGGYENCLHYRENLPTTAPIRFQRIFTSRPGHALLTAPFVRVLGGAGFSVGTAALGVACGLALLSLALAIGMRPAEALLAEVAFFLLPTGLWVSRLLAEAPAMLFVLIAMTGTALLLRGRSRVPAACLVTVGLICLCAVKPANGVALTAALTAVSVMRLPFARSRKAHLLLGAISMIVLVGNLSVSAALHLPGLTETLQDTFTDHFHRPDVARPLPLLAHSVEHLWYGHIGPKLLNNPLIPAAYLLGLIGLFRRVHPDVAWPLTFAGLTGALIFSVHPLPSQVDRLAVVTWVPVAIGLVGLVDLDGLDGLAGRFHRAGVRSSLAPLRSGSSVS